MGKRKGGGGGGGGGGGYNKGRGEDITSARGSGCVIATCNVAREREGSRELVTLLTQMIEKEYPTLEEEKDEEKEEGDESQRELSAEEMMRKEVEGLKSKTSTTQAVVSLQTVSPPHSYSLLLPHSSTRILPATLPSFRILFLLPSFAPLAMSLYVPPGTYYSGINYGAILVEGIKAPLYLPSRYA